MAEQKRRGFGALEKRIHEIEEEDRKQEQQASAGERNEPARTAQGGERKEQPKK